MKKCEYVNMMSINFLKNSISCAKCDNYMRLIYKNVLFSWRCSCKNLQKISIMSIIYFKKHFPHQITAETRLQTVDTGGIWVKGTWSLSHCSLSLIYM